MNMVRHSVFILPMLLLLAACGNDVRDTLGLTKEAPDEFVVVSRPPLVVPPDFELRPPSAEAATLVPSTQEDAQKTLFGGPSAKPVAKSTAATDSATASFLSKAGVDQASPDIRQQLGADAKAPIPSKAASSLYEEVIGKEKSDTVVDYANETKRLLDNKQAGKPVTDGDTPVAPPASTSVLDKIF